MKEFINIASNPVNEYWVRTKDIAEFTKTNNGYIKSSKETSYVYSVTLSNGNNYYISEAIYNMIRDMKINQDNMITE